MSKIVFPISVAQYDTTNSGPQFFALAGTPDAIYEPSNYSSQGGLVKVPTIETSVSGALWILSGTRPTDAQIETNYIYSAFYGAYGGQKLLEYRPLTYTLRPAATADRMIVTYEYPNVVNAVKSGTATWWAVGRYYSLGIEPLFVGDVSNMAGSGEVKLASTTITLGNGYLLSQFSFCISATVNLT
jgi:hypothetical protein